MTLEEKVMVELKAAMKSKDKAKLRSLRAIKSAIIIEKTSGSGVEATEASDIKLLQRLVKQRQDSYDIFVTQGREDLAVTEKEEIDIIKAFLPEQLGQEELENILKGIIEEVGATSPKDMGKVMGKAIAAVAGKSDGKTISGTIKKLLS